MPRWLLLAATIASIHGAVEPFPTPPEQTDEQISNFARTKARAKEASEAATPMVLAYFDSEPFRAMLKDCCPSIADVTSEELLRRYRAEAQVAELAHALPATRKGVFTDVTIKEVGEMEWFPNEFQVDLLQRKNMSAGASQVNDIAQQEVFGCKPFAEKTPTWSEVANRLIYIAHNMRRLDTGSEPFFGDFTVIFNSTHVKDSVVIAPYDTGLYVMVCFRPDIPLPGHLNKSMLPPLNCSAWPKDLPVGTLEYLDHLILPNLAAGANTTATGRTMLDSARDLFTRSSIGGTSYKDVPPLDLPGMGEYLESNILANPRLPEGVKFGIGSFTSLFGSKEGRELQAIAKKYHWPLFWAFGTGNPQEDPHMSFGKKYGSNLRVADPSNIVITTNASVDAAAASSFDAAWQEAEAVRATRNATVKDIKKWWKLLDETLRVAPITSSSCQAVHDCVGIDLAKNECICVKQSSKKRVETFTV